VGKALAVGGLGGAASAPLTVSAASRGAAKTVLVVLVLPLDLVFSATATQAFRALFQRVRCTLFMSSVACLEQARAKI
jgi:hypothetical protein